MNYWCLSNICVHIYEQVFGCVSLRILFLPYYFFLFLFLTHTHTHTHTHELMNTLTRAHEVCSKCFKNNVLAVHKLILSTVRITSKIPLLILCDAVLSHSFYCSLHNHILSLRLISSSVPWILVCCAWKMLHLHYVFHQNALIKK